MTDPRPASEPGKSVWAYGYEIVPPQFPAGLGALRSLVDEERADADQEVRTWQCRFVFEPQITHILVVSDSPRQDLEFNRRLEAQLRELQVAFSLTAPMEVQREPVPPAEGS
jgi:hypothetical protein